MRSAEVGGHAAIAAGRCEEQRRSDNKGSGSHHSEFAPGVAAKMPGAGGARATMLLMRRLVSVLLFAVTIARADQANFDAAAAERFAQLALACVEKEYPNKIGHVLNSDRDAAPPRELTPAFYGCYDWHSSVHGHWLLARLARTFPEAPFARAARAALAAKPHARRTSRGEVGVPARRGAGDLRAAVRPGVAAAARRPNCASGTIRSARRGRTTLRAAGSSGASSGSRRGCRSCRYPVRDRRARADRVRARADARLGAGGARRRRSSRCSSQRARAFYLADRDCPLLRTVRPGLPVAVPRRSGRDAPRAAA